MLYKIVIHSQSAVSNAVPVSIKTGSETTGLTFNIQRNQYPANYAKYARYGYLCRCPLAL